MATKIRTQIVPHFGNLCTHYSITSEQGKMGAADLIHLELTHMDTTYKVGGLCNVVIFPSFQGKGFGSQLVSTITNDMQASNLDLGILFCTISKQHFYSKHGWQAFQKSETRIGSPSSFSPYHALRMMLFISEKGKRGQYSLLEMPLYLKQSL